jgi:DNA-binding NtrC family response regulator
MKPLKILIIDDEEVICNACHLILSEKGHMLERKMDGAAGLKALQSNNYDVVLLDMMLPDMDGMEILETIKQKKPQTGIIVITGYSTVANALKAMKLGATDYLSKPFSEDELLASIEKVCSD